MLFLSLKFCFSYYQLLFDTLLLNTILDLTHIRIFTSTLHWQSTLTFELAAHMVYDNRNWSQENHVQATFHVFLTDIFGRFICECWCMISVNNCSSALKCNYIIYLYLLFRFLFFDVRPTCLPIIKVFYRFKEYINRYCSFMLLFSNRQHAFIFIPLSMHATLFYREKSHL